MTQDGCAGACVITINVCAVKYCVYGAGSQY